MKESNKKSVPDLRFPGFTGEWEQRKLSELAMIHARIGWQNLRTAEFLENGDYLLITGTDFEDGTVNYSNCSYVEKERYDQDKNIQIKNGNILITKDGTLGKVAYVQGLTMPATLNAGVFNIEIKDENKIEGKYLFQYLKAPHLMNYVRRRATGGTIKHLNQNILVDFSVMFPGKIEQAKIGEYFCELDRFTSFHQDKLRNLRKLKKGLAQKIFPQAGEKVPKIRFPGFTDDWEQYELGELAIVRTGYPFDSREFNDAGEYLVITNGNVQEEATVVNNTLGNHISIADSDIIQNYLLNINDILVTMDGNVGRTAKVVDENMILAQRVGRLTAHGEPEFLYQWLNTGSFSKAMSGLAHGGTIKHISLKEICSFRGFVPRSKEEQRMIGEFFYDFDCLINFYQCKLNHVQELKKGLLQQMFV